MKYTTIPITKVEELQVGPKWKLPEYMSWVQMRQRCQNPNKNREKWEDPNGMTQAIRSRFACAKDTFALLKSIQTSQPSGVEGEGDDLSAKEGGKP